MDAVAEMDYPLTRKHGLCPLCVSAKPLDCVVCWACWSSTDRLENADMSRIDKFELALEAAAAERQFRHGV